MSRVWWSIGQAAKAAMVIGGVTLPQVARAASFDCATAKLPRELFICRDADLSKVDGQLGRLYQERRARLSPHGAEALQSAERGWLRYVATVCQLSLPAGADSRRKPKHCLQTQYQQRLGELAEVGQRLGPFVMNRIDLYAASPAPDQTGRTSGFYVQHAAYPQIDNTHSPQIDAWNSRNHKTLPENSDCDGDGNTDYVAGYANEHIISVQWEDSLYCHGTPHGMYSVSVDNLVWRPIPHQLTGKDVFGPQDGWVEKLKALFRTALEREGWNPSANLAEQSLRNIEDYVVEPGNWLFTADGLRVSFTESVGGCYACNPPTVTLPWASLKPVLSAHSVVP